MTISNFVGKKLELKRIFGDATQKFILNELKEAYNSLLKDKKVTLDLNDEETCTAQICYFAKKNREKTHHLFKFELEYREVNFNSVVYHGKKPKTSSRLDIKISHRDWDEDSYMTIEAKRINESTLLNKYIEEGMERFLSSKYAKNNNCGFMLGFVISGNESKIIKKINLKIILKYSKEEILKKLGQDYLSRHNRNKNKPPFKINHLFLDYTIF